jgi:hypothetical protein
MCSILSDRGLSSHRGSRMLFASKVRALDRLKAMGVPCHDNVMCLCPTGASRLTTASE